MASGIDREGVFWLAGEASGDFIASLVMPQVRDALGGALCYGIGGPKMAAEGFRAWHDISELSVRGYVEVLQHLPRLWRLRRSLAQRISDSLPRAFIGVDAPDFNLGLETELRRRRIPVIHMVSPSIWAWRPERIQTIRRAVDHMLLLFPFEAKIYRRAGIAATFVGHPLAGIIPMQPQTEAARAELGVQPEGRPVLCVMPGSRKSELAGCGAIFFEAVSRLIKRAGAMEVLIPVVSDEAKVAVQQQLAAHPTVLEHAHIVVGASHRMIEASDAVLVASGTAALECALYKKPMVVGYRMPGLTGLLMEKKGLIDCVSLPNILLGEKVVPEFLQFFCEPDQISWALEDALQNDAKRAQLIERFSELHTSLMADTAGLTAEVVARLAKS